MGVYPESVKISFLNDFLHLSLLCLVNTILVKSVTYYSLSDITVIRGSWRGKIGSGISLSWNGKMGFTALGKGWTILKMAVWFLSLEDFDSIVSQTFAQISHFLEVEKSNYTSVTSVAMHEWTAVSFPVQWFVVAEMTCTFEKDQNGVRFGKCFPHFAQLWSSKCFSSANNAVIRTENCKL